jgi:hypothetical protein
VAAVVWASNAAYTNLYPVMVGVEGTATTFISKVPGFQFNASQGTITIGGNIAAQGVGTNTFSGPGTFSGTLSATGNISTCGTVVAKGNINTCASIVAKGNITGYGCFSDIRLKENIRPISDALAKLRTLEGVLYDWTAEFMETVPPDISKHDTGLIAQEVQKVLPEVIFERDNGYLGIKYEKVVGLIVQAINELADRVDRLTE